MRWTKIRRIILLLTVILSITFTTACEYDHASDDRNDNGTKSTAEELEEQLPNDGGPDLNGRTDSDEPGAGQKDEIMQQIAGMTIEEKIGQMVIVGMEGHTYNEHSRQMIEDYHVGGFILFKRNIHDVEQTVKLINSLKASNLASGIPLFISVDEEGGRVTRMPDELTRLPSANTVGKLDNGDIAYNFGKVTAQVLRSLGFNTDFAPVMDVSSNPDNRVIGDRAFGSKPDLVARLGVEVMKGIQSQNIISVVKHFPGHGDTKEDSHLRQPIVERDLERLKSFELLPFYRAVENGVDAVMVAHILFPRIDRDNPSSLSKIFITDILRKDMGFDGVVITDDMTMGAIAENYDIGEAAVKSINAGSDIILVCHDYSKQTAVIETLLEAAKNGAISEETINSSVYRVINLKEKYGLEDQFTGPANIDYINNLIKNVNKQVTPDPEQ